MCNHYRNDIRKLGLEREIYGYEEFAEFPHDIYASIPMVSSIYAL